MSVLNKLKEIFTPQPIEKFEAYKVTISLADMWIMHAFNDLESAREYIVTEMTRRHYQLRSEYESPDPGVEYRAFYIPLKEHFNTVMIEITKINL